MCDFDGREDRVQNYGDPRSCLDGISFIENFWVADAPEELEEVEAALDAEPPQAWEAWARRGVVAFVVAFWGLMIWLLLR
ncbi:MAG: hypothetical protein GX458_08780 [Phyllobacteriaceae bacterium]|nr:hypothetical protein [Phyllobacteriaceae bacterium]